MVARFDLERLDDSVGLLPFVPIETFIRALLEARTAGYGEESQDLLLEERWTLDADYWFLEPAPNSHGLWLSAGNIVSLELYDPIYERSSEGTS